MPNLRYIWQNQWHLEKEWIFMEADENEERCLRMTII